MKIRPVVLLLSVFVSLTGCATKPEIIEVKKVEQEVAPLPVVFMHDAGARNLYTKSPNYILCFGEECDKPTPKRQKVAMLPAVMPQVQMPSQVVNKAVVRTESRVKESVEYLYNTTEISKDSIPVLNSIIDSAKGAKEVIVKGFAGLTITNEDNERRVLGLALSRARDIERRVKEAGVMADIKISAELVKCKSEQVCLDTYRYGGRRADVEIVIIRNGE
jgi:hypothetical protein